jgi:sulfate permease, SulP family
VLLVGYTDNILTARAFAGRRGPEREAGRDVDANQELVALGVANAGAGLLHGFPVSSSGSRTALADAAAARTQLYSLVSLASVVATLLFLWPLLTRFPTAALGAIVVYAAVRLIEMPGFRRLAAFRRSELLLALGALVGVLVFDILYGVVLAVGLSVAEMLSRVARPHDAIQGLVPGLAGMHEVDDYRRHARCRVLWSIGMTPAVLRKRGGLPPARLGGRRRSRRPGGLVRHNTEANVEVDITALDALEALRRELEARGTTPRWVPLTSDWTYFRNGIRWTSGSFAQILPKPIVAPALTRAKPASTAAKIRCSSMNGLVVGGSATDHIITYRTAPEAAAIRTPMPSTSARPMPSRPSMKAQLAKPVPAR